MRSHEQILNDLEQLVGPDPIAQLKATRRETIALQLRPAGTAAPTRASMLGPPPMLPKGALWPASKERPLHLVAAIRLSELPRISATDGFPGAGVLMFWYEMGVEAWGFDPKDADSFRVTFEPNEEKGFVPVDAHWLKQGWGALKSHSLEFAKAWSYEPEEHSGSETLSVPASWTADGQLDWDAIEAAAAQLIGPHVDEVNELMNQLHCCIAPSREHRIGGFPRSFQYSWADLQLQCELVSNGVYCGDSKWTAHERLPEFRSRARSWRLLLQVDSDDRINLGFGDAGLLYYMIRDEDLQARRFDRVWIVVDSA